MKPITFIANGYRLAGNFFVPNSPKSVAFLFIQGWTGNQNLRAAQMLADAGYPSMTYDMRGNKDSEGDIAQYSRADFVSDSTVAYDFLKQQIDPGTVIAVIGSSFGSYTAILLSRQREVGSMSLRVPANYPDEGFDLAQLEQKEATRDFSEWRHERFEYTQNHALRALHEFKGKIQIIRAEADELVPKEVPENYVAAIADQAQLTYQIMMDAPHRLENKKLQTEYERLLMNWVRETFSNRVN